MKYPRFYSFRNFMDMCLKESKIDELIKSQDLIFFFKKGKNIYGGTEENRVMFARMKDKSDKSPPLSLDEKPTFSAINIKKLIDSPNREGGLPHISAKDDSVSKLEKTFSEEDVDKIKIIDIKEIKEKLSE
jgi:hypothetical protein